MKVLSKVALICVVLAGFSGNLTATYAETGFHESISGQPQGMEKGCESDENVGAWFASLYQNYISRVDSHRCPSIPTCSSYSGMAFRKHGFFIGWLMTVDRLIHEGDEGSFSPRVYHGGRFRTLDPIENNDFWWFGRDGTKPK